MYHNNASFTDNFSIITFDRGFLLSKQEAHHAIRFNTSQILFCDNNQ